jgi:predicted DCC family thiol-disulfide oxidoreductase YuxK
MALSAETVTETIFYDGHCGLCHRMVRFVLAADRDGRAFRFAPLGGETFLARVPKNARVNIPDSVAVQSADKSLLIRSAAVLYILRRLGGRWSALAAVFRVIPRPLRDGIYDWVARIRYRLFARPADVCPVMPPELRRRFDL